MSTSKFTSIAIRGTAVRITSEKQGDYICFTDIARFKNPEASDDLIRNWLRNRTVEFLGIWEQLNSRHRPDAHASAIRHRSTAQAADEVTHSTATAMKKILLVEDNEMNRDMLSRRLERKGYSVVMAVDGQQGVDMALSEAPALILMDMSLPIIDGWEATRRIKADERTRHIPVIALTAHAMDGDEQKAREAGCDDYDTKPVELPRLLGKMEALLGVPPTA